MKKVLSFILLLFFSAISLFAQDARMDLIEGDSAICQGTGQIAFDVSGSTDWTMVDWGDGTTPEEFFSNPGTIGPHQYDTAGLFIITFVALDPPTDTATYTVRVWGIDSLLFSHDYSSDVCMQQSGITVNFTDQSIFVNPTSFYVFDYGDGYEFQSYNASHSYTYNLPGIYMPTARSVCGTYYADTIEFLSDTNIVPDFTFQEGCPCNEIQFSAQTTSSNISWDFGDNTSDLGADVLHTFPSPGNFLVSVKTVDNSSGCVQTIRKNIKICGGDTSHYSHSNDQWHFGGPPVNLNGVRLTFQPPYNTSPVADTFTAMRTLEGSASVCDPETGDLLFYTNGVTIWNKNNDTLANGDSILSHNSSTQSSLIVPFPGDESKYYLFTSNGVTNVLVGNKGYHYCIIEMDTLGGLGAVIEKNVPLFIDSCAVVPVFGNNVPHESLTGTIKLKGSKGDCSRNAEYWVVIPACPGKYHAYLITDQGINPPVVSNFSYTGSYNLAGQSAFSPNGRKFALVEGVGVQPDYFLGLNEPLDDRVRIFDFDLETGQLNNESILYYKDNSPFYDGVFSISFSPSGNILYIASIGSEKIFQFNLEQENQNSEPYVLFAPENVSILYQGPDDKIYIANILHDTLSVIHAPDEFGINCNLEQNAIYCGGGITRLGLQNIIPLMLPKDSLLDQISMNLDYVYIPEKDSANCSLGNIQFQNLSDTITYTDCSYRDPKDTLSYFWSFGDGNYSLEENPIHAYQFSGTYEVKLIVSRVVKCFSDSISTFLCIYASEDSTNPDTTDFFIPNAFSPNGDGLNDILYVHGLFTEHVFSVFDRHGKLLYNTFDQLFWDGTYKDKIVSSGVYVYKFYGRMTGTNTEIFQTGTLSLIKD